MMDRATLESLQWLKRELDGVHNITRQDRMNYSAAVTQALQRLTDVPPLNFVVSIPYWGPWHAHTCATVTVPSVLAAINYAKAENRVRFIIHTISPDVTRGLLKGFEVEYLPLPAHPDEWMRFSMGHKETLFRAKDGECLCLLCADNLVSRELFTFTEWAVASSYKAIAALGPRVSANPVMVPLGAEASQLAKWAMENAHPWTKSLYYKTGNSNSPSVIYFHDAQGISGHGFHLHPVMVLKDRYLNFKGGAIDADLLNCFSKEDIYVVANNEMFMCDITQPERQHGTAGRLDDDAIIQWAKNPNSVLPLHRWNFKHRITFTGTGANSQSIANSILQQLEMEDGDRPSST